MRFTQAAGKAAGHVKKVGAAGLVAALAFSMAACGGSGDEDNADGKTIIVVGDRPSPDQTEAAAVLDKQIKQFESSHPDIKIKSVETKWEAQTFQAMLAGGTMPTVMNVAFTEPQSLIAAGQIADITEVLEETGLGSKLNPAVTNVVKDEAGKIYGIPIDVYSVGLAYNRELFTQAGLDPDKPPATWDEVRAAAKTITEKTGAAGYATFTADNFGGWMMTGAVASFGGEVQNTEGTKATINTPEVKGYLDMVKAMRWEDNSMGSNFVYSAEPAKQDFAAGKIGMILNLAFDYPAITVNYKMDTAHYGFTSLPQATDESRTLTGGAAKVFSPKASKEELKAAVEWIEYQNFEQYFDEKTAVDNAKAAADDGGVVGLPVLSPVSDEEYKQLQTWIEPYINVNLPHFAGYTAVANTQTLVPEPRNKAQEVYAELDKVLQAVLTKQDVDLDSLLSETETNINSKLGR